MLLPTKTQIEASAEALAIRLGGGVHVHGHNLISNIDASFYGMNDAEFDNVSAMCNEVANTVRSAAMLKMWA